MLKKLYIISEAFGVNTECRMDYHLLLLYIMLFLSLLFAAWICVKRVGSSVDFMKHIDYEYF